MFPVIEFGPWLTWAARLTLGPEALVVDGVWGRLFLWESAFGKPSLDFRAMGGGAIGDSVPGTRSQS